jgi:uracil-DNA glycosylase family 4
MSTDRPAELRALLAFYVEAGVDAVLDDTPADRFTAEAPAPRPAPAEGRASPAGAPSRTLHQHQQTPSPERSPANPGARPGTAGVPQPPLYPPPRAGEGRVGAAGRPRSHGGPGSGPGAAPLPPDAAIMAAREAAASAKSLDELRALLERFEGCALRFTAKRLVFADGNPKARVMIVGEAPGRDEDLAGLPFVGRSGQLLDRILAAIGLDRTSVYIANLVPWRPPGNRTPTPQESQICLPFLKRQIELADPDILVCLGGPSSAALLGMTDGIRKFRGRWRTYHTGTREIRAIASFHPSYLLRTPLEKRSAWRDFLAIRAALAE